MSEFVFLYRGGERGRSPEAAQQMMQNTGNASPCIYISPVATQ